MKEAVTLDAVERRFVVDLENGRMYWRTPPSNHPRLAGKEAGSPRFNSSGKCYWHIKIGGKAYKRSHLIFYVATGEWPSPCIDHIDGNSENDRLSNLRVASITENAWNHKGRAKRSSLPMGVRTVGSGRFQARIAFNKTMIHLGAFDTADEARTVYLAKRKELYREFA